MGATSRKRAAPRATSRKQAVEARRRQPTRELPIGARKRSRWDELRVRDRQEFTRDRVKGSDREVSNRATTDKKIAEAEASAILKCESIVGRRRPTSTLISCQ